MTATIHYSNHLLSGCLVAWLEFLKQRKIKLFQQRAAIFKIQKLRLYNHFVAWRAQAQVDAATRRAIKLLRTKYETKQLRNMITGWRYITLDKLQKRHKVEYFLQDAKERKMKRAFENWQAFVAMRRIENNNSTKASLHRYNSVVPKMFAAWLIYTRKKVVNASKHIFNCLRNLNKER